MFFLQKKWGAKTKSKRKLPLPLLSKIGGWWGELYSYKGHACVRVACEERGGDGGVIFDPAGSIKKGGDDIKNGGRSFLVSLSGQKNEKVCCASCGRTRLVLPERRPFPSENLPVLNRRGSAARQSPASACCRRRPRPPRRRTRLGRLRPRRRRRSSCRRPPPTARRPSSSSSSSPSPSSFSPSPAPRPGPRCSAPRRSPSGASSARTSSAFPPARRTLGRL